MSTASDLGLAPTLSRPPPRPALRAVSAPADPAFVALGARMMPVLLATRNVTLAGFRLLDPNGVVIAGGGETDQSLSHLEEVAEALQGTGMGLAIVRAMLDVHGGTICFTDSAEGTAFELAIPLADAPTS
jgi:hypothetical protein